ncbi:hypothetical protein NZK35_34135 [Stieleria sp. ICT_E10.1]|nr:hypothetical protein [Stieleria sedimenti]
MSLHVVLTSQLVIDEASLGDADAASRRLEALDGIPVLPVNPDADRVADAIIANSMMTDNPILDELHAARQQLLSECGGDTAEYLRQAAKRLSDSGRPIAKVKQRTKA